MTATPTRRSTPLPPLEMIERYSADAVRYWAASTGFGRDSVISEEKIQVGARLVTKLWNVGRLAEKFITPVGAMGSLPLPPTDRWLLSRLQRLIRRATELFRAYDYAGAKAETEAFFWNDLADNYLELVKQRLYDETAPGHEAARWTLTQVLLAVLKLFAPFLPYVTEALYQELFAAHEGVPSVHRARWPEVNPTLEDEAAEAMGTTLVAIATAVRRYKSERALSLGAAVAQVRVVVDDPALVAALYGSEIDLRSVTRAREVLIGAAQPEDARELSTAAGLQVAVVA